MATEKGDGSDEESKASKGAEHVTTMDDVIATEEQINALIARARAAGFGAVVSWTPRPEEREALSSADSNYFDPAPGHLKPECIEMGFDLAAAAWRDADRARATDDQFATPAAPPPGTAPPPPPCSRS